VNLLFRLLFPKQYTALRYAQNRLAVIESEFQRKFSSFQRSPLDESQWVSKFVALDRDYMALEKEVAELRVENWCLKRDIRKLTS
jgi:cell division protein FtsB